MLDGITVLDLSSVGPAARASRWLADYGAAVVKVAPKDPALQITPPPHAYGGQRGMSRVELDLKDPADREAFLDLAAAADVLIESFRPGVMAKLGVGYDDVRVRNPRLVYCSTTGYGQGGERSQWAGHDLNYLAMGGYLAMTQPRADGGPPIPGATIADSAGGGMHAVMAILAALVARGRSGEGAYLDVSVAAGVAALMELHIDEVRATGEQPDNVLTGRYACYDTYRAGDGRWLAVAAIERRFWANLCRLLGLERWVERQDDDDAQSAIRTDLAAAFAAQPAAHWVELLAGADTCVTLVRTVAEVATEDLALAGTVR